MNFCRVLAGVLFLACIAQARPFSPPKNGEVYLITVGLGKALYTRYGHTVLRIIDSDTNADYNFNWGIFDYDSQLAFGFVFFKGILTYKLGISSYGRMHYHYTKREKRSMVQNKINLTSAQKEKLYQLIATNLRPENITYHYQYFFHNCATIIRDYLDLVLHHKIKEKFQAQMTTTTFRDYTRTNLNYPPIVIFGLDMVMNSRIDYSLSQWQEMFYPLKLQEHLAQLQAVDDNGNFTAEPLLSSDEIIYQGKGYPSSEVNIFQIFLMLSLVFILLSALLYRKTRIPAALLIMAWGVFAALLSILMIVSWLYSEHLDLHHNANLWLFWPSDIIFSLFGFKLLLRKETGRWYRFYFFIHLGALLVFTGLRLGGVIAQNVDAILLYVSPLLIIFCLAGMLPRRIYGTS